MGFSSQEYWSGVPLPSPNMLSKLVKTFLPRSKCLLISWLQSPSAVILDMHNSLSHYGKYYYTTAGEKKVIKKNLFIYYFLINL